MQSSLKSLVLIFAKQLIIKEYWRKTQDMVSGIGIEEIKEGSNGKINKMTYFRKNSNVPKEIKSKTLVRNEDRRKIFGKSKTQKPNQTKHL